MWSNISCASRKQKSEKHQRIIRLTEIYSNMRTRCGTRVGPPRRAPSRSPSPNKPAAAAPAAVPVVKRRKAAKKCPKCHKKMVFTAIMQLRDRNGASARKITKFAVQEYKMEPAQAKKVIRKQLSKGTTSLQ